MKKLASICLLLVSFVSLSFKPSPKDKVSYPSSYEFTFDNGVKTVIVSKQDTRLKRYNDGISAHRLKPKTILLVFASGEKINFKTDGKKWTAINISYQKSELAVPKKVLDKISEIDLTTVCLLWSADKEKAFDSKYFYIKCDTGTKKSFNKLPSLQLNFKNKKFSGAEIWTQIDENNTQGKML
jgi:lipopolysaccharide export LptBFGC system permease protein LptF